MNTVRRIHKYPLDGDGSGTTVLDIPIGGRFLCAAIQSQRGRAFRCICLWFDGTFTIGAENATEKWSIGVYGTGQDLPFSGEYLDTVHEAQFVWHVLRERSP